MQSEQAHAQDVTPVRVQRRRTKGWRMPPNTVSVTRPGKWGNPYLTAERFEHDLRLCLASKFVATPDPRLKRIAVIAASLHELRGKNLACYCPPGKPCHADVLLKLANAAPTPLREGR